MKPGMQSNNAVIALLLRKWVINLIHSPVFVVHPIQDRSPRPILVFLVTFVAALALRILGLVVISILCGYVLHYSSILPRLFLASVTPRDLYPIPYLSAPLLHELLSLR